MKTESLQMLKKTKRSHCQWFFFTENDMKLVRVHRTSESNDDICQLNDNICQLNDDICTIKIMTSVQ